VILYTVLPEYLEKKNILFRKRYLVTPEEQAETCNGVLSFE
jgi:hypothetical protein